jgi:hypothetical protein
MWQEPQMGDWQGEKAKIVGKRFPERAFEVGNLDSQVGV